jgi:hypothetical protein
LNFHVCEHDGYDFAFALNGTSRGQYLVGKVLGGVGTWPVEIQRRSFKRFAQIIAAFAAKDKIRRICKITLWTHPFQGSATFATKLHFIRVLKLAFWAFHGSVLQIVNGKWN